MDAAIRTAVAAGVAIPVLAAGVFLGQDLASRRVMAEGRSPDRITGNEALLGAMDALLIPAGFVGAAALLGCVIGGPALIMEGLRHNSAAIGLFQGMTLGMAGLAAAAGVTALVNDARAH